MIFLGHSVGMLSHIDFVSFILSHDNKVLGGGEGADPGGVVWSMQTSGNN